MHPGLARRNRFQQGPRILVFALFAGAIMCGAVGQPDHAAASLGQRRVMGDQHQGDVLVVGHFEHEEKEMAAAGGLR